jgi:signal transduction histidine kinase
MTSLEAESEEDNTVTIKIAVKDTGLGIRKEDMNKLFCRFSQVDSSK